MTVCIAAIARKPDQIIMACDMMLSDERWSTETWTSKAMPLSRDKKWWGMYSGDPTEWEEMWPQLRTSLDQAEERTPATLKDALESAYDAALKHKVERKFLAKLGLNLARFLDSRQLLGDAEWNRLLYEIRREKLKTSVLLAGYDSTGIPRLMRLADNGEIEQSEGAGFDAIGVGSLVALSCLHSRYDKIATDLVQLAYRVLEAKFLGEMAPGVGRRTVIYGLKKSREVTWIAPELIELVRKQWIDEGDPPPPQRALNTIKGLFLKARFIPVPRTRKKRRGNVGK